jgi:hypothetical protein
MKAQRTEEPSAYHVAEDGVQAVVFLRENIQSHVADGERPAYWSYDEYRLTLRNRNGISQYVQDNFSALLEKAKNDEAQRFNESVKVVDIESKVEALKKLLAPSIDEIPDEEIDDYASLIPPWIVGEDVVQGNKRQYGGYVYKCGQGHKTQVDWTPDVAISLWSRAAEVDPGTGYEVWKAWDGHNESLYQVGDIVWYPSIDTQLYISTAGNNHWEPGVFGWTVYNP